MHPLHMGGIVQLNEVAFDGIALYAFDLNRVGKDGICLLYTSYVKTMQMRITDSGDVVLEFKRK